MIWSLLYGRRSAQARLQILPFARQLSLLKAFILASVQLHLLLLARAYRDDGKADNASRGKPERDF
ncbi:hypothetical protein U1708_17660 [Sphingomonas sp. ZB1N12]|uniref:hypothetical protein n=1 Tax=Sphingomonas arabinosi TaxID=3096160 RepID=UPI002FC69526